MKHSDQSTDNEIDGDVGTSIQAGSIEINVGAPRKFRWRKGFWYLIIPALIAVVGASTLVLKLVSTNGPVSQTPVAATTVTSVEAGTTASPPPSTAGPPPPHPPPAARTARPAPAGQMPSPPTSTPIAVTPVPTTTVTVAAAPPPTVSGVRYSGALKFGSFHLDLPQPRDIPGTNIWPLTPNRLHGDDGYWLTEWIGDGVPGKTECAADLVERATRDADNLIVGSRVCGKTPAGRTFLVDVVATDGTTITGQVTVWEQA